MATRRLPILLCFVAALSTSFAAPTKLAFERDGAIWIAELDGSGAKKISAGASPALSPDETKLAFNTEQAIGQPAHRKIAIANLTSGLISTLDDVPSDNCLGAVWSPNGKQRLFYLYLKQRNATRAYRG